MKYYNLELRRFGIASFLSLTLISFCLLLFLFSSSDAYELVKTEQKTFNLRSGSTLQMTVDIGNIKLIIWDEEKVFVQIRKWVDASSESQAEKKMQKLEVDFIEENNLLVISQLNRQDKSFFSNVLKKTGLKKKSSSRIDFVLKVPSRLTVIIDHTKGKIEIDSLLGTIEIKQDEGELFLNELSLDKLDLHLGSVQTKIQKLKGQNNSSTSFRQSYERLRQLLRILHRTIRQRTRNLKTPKSHNRPDKKTNRPGRKTSHTARTNRKLIQIQRRRKNLLPRRHPRNGFTNRCSKMDKIRNKLPA